MVIAYHLILTCYGFWLPNDPRGSWSTFVRSFELYRAGGPATKTDARHSVAHAKHDHAARQRAKAALKYPPVNFDGAQAREVMCGIGDYVEKNQRPVHAAAVMPDHVHLLVGRCDSPIETIGEQMKARATSFLNKVDLHPLAEFKRPNATTPSPWARNQWSVFLHTSDDLRRVARYVENNPIKAGYRSQKYEWVTPLPV